MAEPNEHDHCFGGGLSNDEVENRAWTASYRECLEKEARRKALADVRAAFTSDEATWLSPAMLVRVIITLQRLENE